MQNYAKQLAGRSRTYSTLQLKYNAKSPNLVFKILSILSIIFPHTRTNHLFPRITSTAAKKYIQSQCPSHLTKHTTTYPDTQKHSPIMITIIIQFIIP